MLDPKNIWKLRDQLEKCRQKQRETREERNRAMIALDDKYTKKLEKLYERDTAICGLLRSWNEEALGKK